MIYFVRHGEVQNNIDKIFCDESLQIPLTEKGIKQVEASAEELKNVNFDICYCSPLKRAVQTMEILTKYHPNLNVKVDERIAERSWGEASGLSVEL